MPAELIKYGFSGGVFSRALQGRPDLEKYDLGLAKAENFFVDYRGGATSRAGTQFCEQAGAVDLPAIRFFSFRFNRLLSNNYLLVFTPEKLRFVQDGAYVLESAVAVSGIVGNTVTATAHGYAIGDLVQISARTYVIGAVTTNTFTTLDFAGNAENPTGTTVQRVYTIDTPYTSDMLAGLQFRQRRDMIRITTLDYGPMDLTRAAHTSWSLTAFDSGGADVNSPSAGHAATASAAGSASVNWAVTSVDQEGRESFLTTIKTASSIVDYTNTAGSIKFSWTPVAGAKYYNVYRSLVFPAAGQNSIGQQLGFIGRAYGASFTDTNVTPNFGVSPQTRYNPFDVGQVAFIEITNAGSGYTSDPTVAVTGGGGSGFVGLPIRSSGNTIEGVLVLNPGSGYSGATVSFTGGGGSNAAGIVHLGDATGLNPAVAVFYGQRAWLMGTVNFPMTLFSGRGDDIFSFSRSQITTALDPYELEIEAPELTPIKFAEPLTDNLFIFTDSGVYQIAPTDSGYASTQRTQNGVGRVRPIAVNSELVFTMPDGSGVRAIRPGNVPNAYVDADLTIYAGDYFSAAQEIVSWSFARTPYRILWAVKADGMILSFTYVPEHNIYAWTHHSTLGYALECANVLENGIDVTYFAVRRDGGVFIERLVHREFETVEDIWESDCGLASTLTYPAFTATVVDADDENWTVTVEGASFTEVDEGSHFRAGGGMGIVTAASSTVLTVQKIIDIEARKPQTEDYPSFASGQWSLTAPVTSVGGLRHLVGQEVEIMADGSFIGTRTVSINGSVSLDTPATKIIVGLPFDGQLQTLPMTASDQVIESRRKRLVGVALRLEKSRALWYGTPDGMYELFDRLSERLGEPTRFQSGVRDATLLGEWKDDGTLIIEKRGPAAISLLGYVIDTEIGDDPQ